MVLDQRDRGRGPHFHDWLECLFKCFGAALFGVSFASAFVAEALTAFALSFGLVFLVSSGWDDVGEYLVALHGF